VSKVENERTDLALPLKPMYRAHYLALQESTAEHHFLFDTGFACIFQSCHAYGCSERVYEKKKHRYSHEYIHNLPLDRDKNKYYELCPLGRKSILADGIAHIDCGRSIAHDERLVTLENFVAMICAHFWVCTMP